MLGVGCESGLSIMYRRWRSSKLSCQRKLKGRRAFWEGKEKGEWGYGHIGGWDLGDCIWEGPRGVSRSKSVILELFVPGLLYDASNQQRFKKGGFQSTAKLPFSKSMVKKKAGILTQVQEYTQTLKNQNLSSLCFNGLSSTALDQESDSPKGPWSISQEWRQRSNRCVLGVSGESFGAIMKLILSELQQQNVKETLFWHLL